MKPDLMTAARKLDAFRAEMIDMEKRMAKLAADFLKLGAYEDAAICAMRADVFKLVLGRIPATAIVE